MGEFAKSTRLFLWGILRRSYVLLPGVVGGGIDVYERVSGSAVDLPSWLGWFVLGFSVFIAAAWSYHDLRMATAGEQGHDGRRAALKDLLGGSVMVGAEVVDKRIGPLTDGWKKHTEALVTAALGQGEAVRVFSQEIRGMRPLFTTVHGRLAEPISELPPPYGGRQVNALRELIGRVDDLAVYDGFEPSDWSSFDPSEFEAAHMRPLKIEEREDGTERPVCPWCGHGSPSEFQTRCNNCEAELWESGAWRADLASDQQSV